MYKALTNSMSFFPNREESVRGGRRILKIIKVFNCRDIFKISYFHKMTAYVAVHNEAVYSYLVPGKM